MKPSSMKFNFQICNGGCGPSRLLQWCDDICIVRNVFLTACLGTKISLKLKSCLGINRYQDAVWLLVAVTLKQ